MPEIRLEAWWALAVGMPIAVALLLLSVAAHRRRGRTWWQIGAVVGPRAILMVLLLLLASRPVIIQSEQQLRRRNRVALLIDRSASMALTDGRTSRYRQAVDFARDRLLPALKDEQIGVEPLLFAEDVQTVDGTQIARATPDGKQTNLPRAIARSMLLVEPAPL
ncbi:MAG: VWA domain-containing protein, partial [Planctomycetes bacterium]|nr:VWA domain-containing protein [Planctomycetota bacterium]